ncbi:hypothetical protein, partial [Stenoxybacter acetivorans]|uniref:hypothetical protein n=1 Tax=Stenoxybacter acetivorans TaxID=422441 RepID=UPI00056CF8B2
MSGHVFTYGEALQEFDYIVTNINQVKDKELSYIRENINKSSDEKRSDLNILKLGGTPFLIEPLRLLQPLSYAVLAEHASEYHVGFYWWRFPPNPNIPVNRMHHFGFLVVKNRLIWVRYKPDSPTAYYDYNCLPPVIKNSWFKNTSSWGVSDGVTPLVVKLLPTDPYDMFSAFSHYFAVADKKWKKTIVPCVQEKIPNIYGKGKFEQLRCFLDSRLPESNTLIGDQLYVVLDNDSQRIYWVKDFDFINIHYLENPAEALDAYCAHTLL